MNPDAIDYLKRLDNLLARTTESKEGAQMGDHMLQPVAAYNAAFERPISIDVGRLEGRELPPRQYRATQESVDRPIVLLYRLVRQTAHARQFLPVQAADLGERIINLYDGQLPL
jgi:hypothetical protein